MKVAVAYFEELKKEDLVWALLQAGFEAEVMSLGLSIYSTDEADAQKYADFIKENAIDAVLTYDFCPALSDGCQICNIPYIAWIYDCPQQALYEQAIGNDKSFIFSFDHRQVETTLRNGGAHVFYQPLGTNIMRNAGILITKEDESRFSCDVSFIGNLFSAGLYDLASLAVGESVKSEIDEIIENAFGKWDGTDRISKKLSPKAIEALKGIDPESFGEGFRMDADDFFSTRLLAYRLANMERRRMLEQLSGYGIKFYTGEKNVDIPGVVAYPPLNYIDELPKAYHLSRINVNLTLHSITTGVPLRVFDIMGVGGFVLSNYQPDIEELFEIDKEIVVYKDLDEMEDKVKYYLSHEEARQRIALNGLKAVKARFDNEKLVKSMIEKVLVPDEHSMTDAMTGDDKQDKELEMSSIKETLRQLITAGNMDEAYEVISSNLRAEIGNMQSDSEYCVLAANAYMAKEELDTAFDIITMGLLADDKNYELALMLGEYYGRFNLNQALVCFYHALCSCNVEEDREVIIEYINNVVEQGAGIVPVSFVVVAHNESAQLKKCLDSIKDNVPVEVSEIVVIDNASTDNTRKWLSEYEGITCGFSDVFLGYTAAANEGIKLCSEGNDVLLLDADAFLLDNSFFYLMLAQYSDDKVGVVGCLTNDFIPDQTMTTGTTDINESIRIAAMVNSPMKTALETSCYVADFAMLIRRWALDEVGLLDESFKDGIYEDKDYCIRVNKAGGKVLLAFNSYIYKTLDREKLYGISEQQIQKERAVFKEKWGFDADYSNNARKDIIGLMERSENAEIKVLELGCAMGSTLNRIKRLWPASEVYGVEYDKAVAEVAGTMADIIHGDVETMNIPYEKDMFDYLIFADVLEHLRDPEAALKRLLPYMKDDGRIIVSLPNIRNHIVLQLLAVNGRFDYGDDGILDRTHLRFFTRDTAMEMLEKCGLKVIRIERNYNKCPEKVDFIDVLNRAFDIEDSDELRVFQYQFVCKKA